jgi:quinol monooxygenase YgiN
MIIIAGTVDLKPEVRDEALAATRQLMEDTRSQPGCLDYVWSADGAVPGRIYVFERWTDRDCLTAHFEGRYYREMRDAMASFGLLGADVSKYRSDVQEPVYGPDMKPTADFKS